MSIFTEQQMQGEIARAIKEKLSQGGLSGLTFKLYFKSGDKFDIVFEGANEAEIEKAEMRLPRFDGQKIGSTMNDQDP